MNHKITGWITGLTIDEVNGHEISNVSQFLRNGGCLNFVMPLDYSSFREFTVDDYSDDGIFLVHGKERTLIPYAKQTDDIMSGDLVITMSMFGYTIAKVLSVDENKHGANAETEDNIYLFEYDEHRGWVCGTQISKKCFEQGCKRSVDLEID